MFIIFYLFSLSFIFSVLSPYSYFTFLYLKSLPLANLWNLFKINWNNWKLLWKDPLPIHDFSCHSFTQSHFTPQHSKRSLLYPGSSTHPLQSIHFIANVTSPLSHFVIHNRVSALIMRLWAYVLQELCFLALPLKEGYFIITEMPNVNAHLWMDRKLQKSASTSRRHSLETDECNLFSSWDPNWKHVRTPVDTQSN